MLPSVLKWLQYKRKSKTNNPIQSLKQANSRITLSANRLPPFKGTVFTSKHLQRIRWKFPFPWWQWLCCFLCRSSIAALQKCPIGWYLEALECLLAWGPWEEDIPSNGSSVALQQSAWWCVWNCCHRQAHCVKWTWSFIWWFILKNAQKRVEQTHIIHIIIYPYNKEQTWTQHKNKLKSKPYSILLSRPLCRIGSQ